MPKTIKEAPEKPKRETVVNKRPMTANLKVKEVKTFSKPNENELRQQRAIANRKLAQTPRLGDQS